MQKIIVTVTDKDHNFFFDMELPAEYPVNKMCPSIVKLLNQNQSKRVFKVQGFFLGSIKKKKIISPERTLEEAGIWNGDYIIVIQK